MTRTDMIMKILEDTGVLTMLYDQLSQEISRNWPALSKEQSLDIACRQDLKVLTEWMLHAYDIYTDDELREVMAFYDSPVGRKMINSMPQMMTALGQTMRNLLPRLRDSIQQTVNGVLAGIEPTSAPGN